MLCDKCKNKPICKYQDNMKDVEDNLQDMKTRVNTLLMPIKVEVTCSKYECENRLVQREKFFMSL